MKRLLKIFTSALLCCTMLTPALTAFSAESNKMQELTNLKALNGNWTMGDVISSNGSGDMFALSETEATDFVYEAYIEFTSHSGAASLVFFSSGNPSRGSYVANIDLSAGNARIFRFESTGGATTKGEFILTNEMRSKNKFNLRVEVKDGYMLYMIDGIPVVSFEDTSVKHGNKLGLLTYNTGVKYSNLGWAPLDENAPTLTGLSGESLIFSGSTRVKQTVSYGTDKLQYTADVNKGNVSARLVNEDSAIIETNANLITVSGITESFDMIVSVTDDEVTRNYYVSVTVESDPGSIYNEQWRPQLHFSPFVNWLNDPNGLVYDPSNETWHLFFQYNPYGLNIANQVWGHAVSTDLMHWKELDIAIPQDHLGAVFSGSAVVDEDNTTGFFTDNKPGESKLVALYTSDGGDTTHGVEKQCIAYSKDHGVTWIKPNMEDHGFENPVISNAGEKYGRDFRDPKIFRYDDKWFMVIAGGRARIFTSDNLIDWTFACDMGFDSECPDLYPLAVDDDENNVKWVYTASGKWYVVGRLEKVKGSDIQYKFVQEGERITYNGGSEVYATQSFYNDGTEANRRIAISWIQDHSASSVSGKTWNGAMTLPYEQTLRTVNGKVILTSYPVSEFNELRSDKIIDLSDTTVDNINDAFKNNPGVAYDTEITFKPSDDAVLEFTLRSNGQHYTSVIYDSNTDKIRVIRSRAGSVTGSIPTGNMEMPLYPDEQGYVTIRIVMDKTVIEVFGNNGEAALCGMIFPNADCINSSLTVSGETDIKSFEMWRMTSIWHPGENILPASGIYFETSAMNIAFDKSTVVTAYEINNNGKRVDGTVTFGTIDTTLVSIVKQDGGTLELKGIKSGKLTLTASVGVKAKKITLSVADLKFVTNLEGWSSKGDWYETENGYSISGSNGDSFAFSNGKNEGSFVYSGEADFNGTAGCLGLVFGASNPDDPLSGSWYGANIDTHNARPVMKLFYNENNQQKWDQIFSFEENADVWKLEVRYTKEGTLTFSVNGEEVSYKVKNLTSGGLGLVSWNGGGSFNNVNYEPLNKEGEDAPGTSGGESASTGTTAPDNNEPNTNDTDNIKKEDPSGNIIVPIVIAVSAIIVIGAVIGVVIVKKRKK